MPSSPKTLNYKKIILLIFATLVIAGIIVILNFRFRYYASGDTSLFLDPKALWERLYTMWDENLNYPLGGQNVSIHIFMPLVFFYQIFSSLPIIVVEYLYFTAVLSAIFLVSFYFFQKYLFHNYIASLFASLLYILNIFFFASFLNYNIHLAFIILPLLFILMQEIIKVHYTKVILILIIISILLPSAFTNPPAVLPLLFITALYFIFLFIRVEKYQRKKIYKALLATFAFALLLNVWWIYPFIDSMFFNYSAIKAIKESADHIFETTSLQEAFRFSGSWAFDGYYLNFKEGKFNMLYVQNPLFILLTFFPIICAYFTIFFKEKKRHLLFFLGLSLLGLALAKGTLRPLGKIYEYVWSHIPGMFMFREPYTKFMLIYVFAIAALFGYFILHITKRKKIRIYVIILSLLAIVIPAYPFFIGGFTGRYQAGPIKSSLVKIPYYLYNYQTINAQRMLKYRTLSLPVVHSHQYNWEGGLSTGNTALKFFTNQPVLIYHSKDAGGKIVDIAYNALLHKITTPKQSDQPNEITHPLPDNDQDKILVHLLGLLNVREIVQENDMDWRWFDPEITKPPSEMAQILDSLETQDLIQKKAELGKFDTVYLKKIPNTIPPQWPHEHNLNKEEKDDLYSMLYSELLNRPALVLYKINDHFFLPPLYTAQNIQIVNNLDAFIQNLIPLKWPMNSVIYLKDQNPNIENIAKNTTDYLEDPYLEFKKINPTKYRLRFHNVQTNFPLIFSTLFSSKWKLYLNNFSPQIIESPYLKDYAVTAQNKDDQANADEVKELIQKGLISSLGDREKIDFISKPFFYTIQNNNLPPGKFYETWSKKPVFTQNQLLANGYANSWWINLETIKQSKQFRQNPDGSLDFEMILEFQPQRFFIIAIFISFATLATCLIYLCFKLKRQKV